MFVSDFVYVDRPFPDVVRDLDHGLSELLQPLVKGACLDGAALRARIGPRSPGGLLDKEIRLEIGEPVTRGDRGELLLVPIAWTATTTPGLFPRMDADLEVVPIGADRTQVSFVGRYEVPFGGFGRGLDALVLHRITQATVRSFLGRLGEALRCAAL